MTSDRNRLLFIYLKETEFIKDDLALLNERYNVRVFQFDANRFSSRAGRFFGLCYYGLKQLVWLVRELPRAEVIYGWFADYHLALPIIMAKWFNVPVVAALGGFDAVELPKLGYGVFHSRWRGPLSRWILCRAALLLPVSKTMIFSENQYSDYPNTLKNGVQHHVTELKTPYKVVPFGYDPADWPIGSNERAPIVCTVAHIRNHRTLKRKGIDLFIEAAEKLPDVKFRVVGISEVLVPEIYKRYNPPVNVEFLPSLPRKKLAKVYANASVYAQLSRAEGQPNVLCEAMCCGCIPVGSAVFGIPETIGNTGFIIQTPELAAVVESIRKALAMASPSARRAARQRIIENYTTKHRRRTLFNLLSQFKLQEIQP